MFRFNIFNKVRGLKALNFNSILKAVSIILILLVLNFKFYYIKDFYINLHFTKYDYLSRY